MDAETSPLLLVSGDGTEARGCQIDSADASRCWAERASGLEQRRGLDFYQSGALECCQPLLGRPVRRGCGHVRPIRGRRGVGRQLRYRHCREDPK